MPDPGVAKNVLGEFLGESRAAAAIREQAADFLARHATEDPPPPILLRGEHGVGKELLARLIHRVGPRAAGPFVPVYCATNPPFLIEDELFGYERDIFDKTRGTNVRRGKAGKFQLAYSGTMFLDEVELLPPVLQLTILKALERRSVRRVGGVRDERTDVWIIAAASRPHRGAHAADLARGRSPCQPHS